MTDHDADELRIDAGPFRSRIFQPTLDLDVADGWSGVELPDAIVLNLHDESCELALDASDYNPATAHGLAELLRSTPGLTATEIVDADVGGRAACVFDADVEDDYVTFMDNSGKTADAGDHVRVMAVEHPEGALSVFITAPAERFSDFCAEALRLLRTLRFTA